VELHQLLAELGHVSLPVGLLCLGGLPELHVLLLGGVQL